MPCTLVTGASMGIGEAFARAFAAKGHDLVIVARTEPLLQNLAASCREHFGVQVTVCVADLASAGAPESIYAFCRNRNLVIDQLVNCAGISQAGHFTTLDPATIRDIAMVNMMATVLLCRLFAADMVERRKGAILNVASLGGLQGVPGLGIYSATKACIITLSEALHAELSRHGVHVSVLCPGFVDTAFFDHAHHDVNKIRLPLLRIESVVEAGLRGMQHKRLRIYPSLLDALLAMAQRFTSRRLTVALAGYFAAVAEEK